MGRHFEVRAKSYAETAAKKSATYMRASKEIYMAAKSGDPNPDSNLALRSAIEKWKGQSVPKDVIDRAIKKAAGGNAESYEAGRYEAFGPGDSYLIIDTLSDNSNRAFTAVRTAVSRKGGHLGSVLWNFTDSGIFIFKSEDRDGVEEALILGDVDVREVNQNEDYLQVIVAPDAFGAARDVLNSLGYEEFETAEVAPIANETITLGEDDLRKFNDLLALLDECEDVQNVYHNVDL
ncbi:MAG: YebC/PmpR family DNA-binding transcriptional regulator [Coprobacillus sp.]|nr:YebC/PmpR family DNA-binding transcriptional regulator [Coprobacillus sp.]